MCKPMGKSKVSPHEEVCDESNIAVIFIIKCLVMPSQCRVSSSISFKKKVLALKCSVLLVDHK